MRACSPPPSESWLREGATRIPPSPPFPCARSSLRARSIPHSTPTAVRRGGEEAFSVSLFESRSIVPTGSFNASSPTSSGRRGAQFSPQPPLTGRPVDRIGQSVFPMSTMCRECHLFSPDSGPPVLVHVWVFRSPAEHQCKCPYQTAAEQYDLQIHSRVKDAVPQSESPSPSSPMAKIPPPKAQETPKTPVLPAGACGFPQPGQQHDDCRSSRSGWVKKPIPGKNTAPMHIAPPTAAPSASLGRQMTSRQFWQWQAAAGNPQ